MKSILHLIETGGPGGAEHVFLELATSLEVGELRSLAAIGRDGWLANQARARGLEPYILPAQGSINIDYARRLSRLIREQDVQLVVAHLFGAAVYASVAGLITGVPVVSILHGQSDVASTERFSGIKRWVVTRGSARIVFVSDALRNDLQPRLALPDGKVAVIENGIDMRRLLPPDEGRLKQALGLPENTFLIGAVGNVRAAKDYETLLRAARQVCDEHPTARFIIAGDTGGGLMPRLESLIQELALADLVRFLGLRSDIPEILAGIDVFVSSSHTEGFSLALVEAMASGKPSIATRSGGPERIIDAGNTGLLVPTRDPSALAAAISSLMNEGASRERLGMAAKSAMTSRYSGVRMLGDYERLISEVLANRRR